MTLARQTLVCGCCKREGMAYKEHDKIVITKDSHGRKHTLLLTLDTLRQMIEDMESSGVK